MSIQLSAKNLRHMSTWLAVFTLAVNGVYALLLAASHQPTERFLEPFIFDGVHFDRGFLLIAGLVLLYMAAELRRRSRWAWRFSVVILGLVVLVSAVRPTLFALVPVPLISLVILILERNYFDVGSEVTSVWQRITQAGVVAIGLYLYSVAGLWLMSRRDFGIYIGLFESFKHGANLIFTGSLGGLVIHSRHARLFLNSIDLGRIAAIILAVSALFRPLKPKLQNNGAMRRSARQLLEKFGGDSEDFFKLWPDDKRYYFYHNSGLAYKVVDDVAVVLGDPIGDKKFFAGLIKDYLEYARRSRWMVGLIYVSSSNLALYREANLTIIKIGEEAVVPIKEFVEKTVRNKHWRNIVNRFQKAGYSCRMHLPPHDPGLLWKLKLISDSWLTRPGRIERTFSLGYFDENYINQCPVLVSYDKHGQAEAFINMIRSYDKNEANIDLFRFSAEAPPNINDYVMQELIKHLNHNSNYTTLNLGACPLKGVGEKSGDKKIISSMLRLVYTSGDKVYPLSFQGLTRFKSKFEPEWRDRYLVIEKSPSNLVRFSRALNKAVTVKD